MKIRVLSITTVLLLALLAGAAVAGNPSRIGTAGAQELRIPNSARGLALGSGLVGDPGGVEVLYYNPASIAGVNRVEAYFSNFSYIADMTKNYLAVATRTSFGTIAVSADVFSIGDIIETTEENPDGTGRIFSPNFSILGLSYGRYMTDQVTVGATVKLISESVLQTHASGLAFDAGIQYRPGPRGLWVGLALKNFGPNMRFEGGDFESFHQTTDNPASNDRSLASQSAPFELPSYFDMGIRYESRVNDRSTVGGYGTFQSNNFYNDELKIGAEYGYRETIYFRAGSVLTSNDDQVFGPAFGTGFSVPIGMTSRIVADYSVQTVKSYFGDTHMLAVKFVF
jgi:hypothetical protein